MLLIVLGLIIVQEISIIFVPVIVDEIAQRFKCTRRKASGKNIIKFYERSSTRKALSPCNSPQAAERTRWRIKCWNFVRKNNGMEIDAKSLSRVNNMAQNLINSHANRGIVGVMRRGK